MSKTTEFATTEVILEKLRFGLNQAISKKYLEDVVDIDLYLDDIANCLVAKVHAYIWAEKLQDESMLIKYPESTWQYFKSEYFPKWLLRKFPVKEKTIKVQFKRHATYPKLAISNRNDTATFVIKEGIDVRELE